MKAPLGEREAAMNEVRSRWICNGFMKVDDTFVSGE